MAAREQGLVVVGGGPAGLAPLFAAASAGRLQELLDRGVTILERGDTLGDGDLGRYAIGSDSSAEALLDIVLRSEEPALLALRSRPVVRAIAEYGGCSVPLSLVGEFLRLAGSTIGELVLASKRGTVLRGARAELTQQTANGGWCTTYTDVHGGLHLVRSQHVVLASGAHQPPQRLWTEFVAGAPLFPAYKGKVIQSGKLLTPSGLARTAHRLRAKRNPRVAIVGGSTSAAAVAHALLTRMPEVSFGEGAITLLHRRPLRIFYETAGEAIADGYEDFCSDDICPLTGRVNRLSGFRLDSKELMLKACRIGDRSRETRLRLVRIRPEAHDAVQSQLYESDLIVAALGYRPRLLPVFDTALRPIMLRIPSGERWAAVDDGCRVLRERGARPLAGLYAIGLAVGPGASRQFGGELGFTGQINSLWLWQHTLGLRIVDQICGTSNAVHSVSNKVFQNSAFMRSPTPPGAHLTELAGAA